MCITLNPNQRKSSKLISLRHFQETKYGRESIFLMDNWRRKMNEIGLIKSMVVNFIIFGTVALTIKLYLLRYLLLLYLVLLVNCEDDINNNNNENRNNENLPNSSSNPDADLIGRILMQITDDAMREIENAHHLTFIDYTLQQAMQQIHNYIDMLRSAQHFHYLYNNYHHQFPQNTEGIRQPRQVFHIFRNHTVVECACQVTPSGLNFHFGNNARRILEAARSAQINANPYPTQNLPPPPNPNEVNLPRPPVQPSANEPEDFNSLENNVASRLLGRLADLCHDIRSAEAAGIVITPRNREERILKNICYLLNNSTAEEDSSNDQRDDDHNDDNDNDQGGNNPSNPGNEHENDGLTTNLRSNRNRNNTF